MMVLNTVSLPAASAAENLQALAEVSDFALTDMGYPGHGPWVYRILQDPFLTTQLAHMSGAKSYRCGVDLVSLQPCPSHVSRSQDRYIVEEWDLPDGTWQFNGVFDGHLNHYTVNFVVQTLPTDIKNALHTLISANPVVNPAHISDILKSSIIGIDSAIISHFLDLFPRDLESLNKLEDSAIRSIFFGKGKCDPSYEIAARSLGGTTLVLSLTDSRQNLWIVSLGDCRAVIGYQSQGHWSGSQINSIHDVKNQDELSRIIISHPGEADVVKDNRVVGFLEPTRAIGDAWLKLPALYTSRVYSNMKQPWISSEKLKEYARRILTPPYVSSNPDIHHCILPKSPHFILLSSDGVLSTDRYQTMEADEVVRHWIRIAGLALSSSKGSSNAALCLLRDVIGGDDTHMVSRNMTVEMDERWMDDTTILIQKVGCT